MGNNFSKKESNSTIHISISSQSLVAKEKNKIIPVVSEFSHSFNPSKNEKNPSIAILNNFIKQDHRDQLESSESLTSDESYCSFDSSIGNYFLKDAFALQRMQTRGSEMCSRQSINNNNGNTNRLSVSNNYASKEMYYKVESKISKKDLPLENDTYCNARTFNMRKMHGENFSFNVIPSLPSFLKKQSSSITPSPPEVPKTFLRKNAMRHTKLLCNDNLPPCPRKKIQIIPFNEDSCYRTLSNKNKSLNDRHLLHKMLGSISFLHDIKKDFAYEIIEEMQYVQIDQGALMIHQNSIGTHVFFIKKGTVKFCPLNFPDKIYETKTGPVVIGERVLINDSIRQWDVYALTPIYAYVIRHKSTINSIKNSINIEREANRACLDNCEALSLMTEEQKDKLSLSMYKEFYNEKTSIIASYDRPNCIFVVVSGSAIDVDSPMKSLLVPGSIFGYNNLVYLNPKNTSQISTNNIKSNKTCVCLSFNYDCLQDVFNDPNYHIRLRNLIIKHKISNDSFFGEVSSLLDNAVLNNFIVKLYPMNSIVVEARANINDFILVILEGDLYSENEPRIKIKEKTKNSVLFSEDVFKGNSREVDCNIRASVDCFVAKMKRKTLTFHIGKNFDKALRILKIKNHLSNTKTFNTKFILNSSFFDSLCEQIEEINLSKNEVIYNYFDLANRLYVIIEGEVKLYQSEDNDKGVTKTKYDCFGISSFTSMLHKNTITNNLPKIKRSEKAICSSEYLLLYSITREKYIESFSENKLLLFYITRRIFYLENQFDLPKLYYFPVKSSENSKGRSFLVRRTAFDDQVAFLRIYNKAKFTNEQLYNDLPQKINILKSIDNQFISKILGISLNSQYIFFLFSFVDGNYLDALISSSFHLNYEIAKFISVQLFLSIRLLHKHNVIHRMINPSTIFVDENGYVKLTHLLSIASLPITKSSSLIGGDIRFMAPETLYGNNEYGPAVDYWSIGVILYLLIVNKLPFNISKDESNSLKIIASIINDDLTFPNNVINEDYKDFVSKLLEKSDEKRYKSWDEVINHPFFNGYDFKAVENFRATTPKSVLGVKRKLNAYKNEKFITFEEMLKTITKEDEEINKEFIKRKNGIM